MNNEHPLAFVAPECFADHVKAKGIKTKTISVEADNFEDSFQIKHVKSMLADAGIPVIDSGYDDDDQNGFVRVCKCDFARAEAVLDGDDVDSEDA